MIHFPVPEALTFDDVLLLPGRSDVVPAQAETANDSVPAPTNVSGAQYPRITPDLRVIFRIKAPDAQKVEFDEQVIGKVEKCIHDNPRYTGISLDADARVTNLSGHGASIGTREQRTRTTCTAESPDVRPHLDAVRFRRRKARRRRPRPAWRPPRR